MKALACAVSAKFSDAIASPYAFPVYVLARILAGKFLPTQFVTLYLSDFANIALILMAVESGRQARKVEKQLDAMVLADPRLDERELGIGDVAAAVKRE